MAKNGINIPPPRRKPMKHPWNTLRVGKWFTIKVGKSKYSSIAGVANRRYAPKRFVSRLIADNKRRVWRTA